MTMNNKDFDNNFCIILYFLFNFILLKNLNNHINHIIKIYIYSYMLYFEIFLNDFKLKI